jgi:hypothetical protein
MLAQSERLASMLHEFADDTKDPMLEWAAYSLLNDLVHCDEATDRACWGEDTLPDFATLGMNIEIRFGYLPDNTRGLFDGSGSYDNTQPEVNSLLAYRLIVNHLLIDEPDDQAHHNH